MGGQVSKCPAGFENDMLLTCRKTCPSDFKFEKQSGTSGECIYKQDNQFRVSTVPLPLPPQNQIPQSYRDETERFDKEIANIRIKIQEQGNLLQKAQQDRTKYVQEFESIQSQAAMFRAGEAIRSVSDSLKPMRPPTAPSSDIEKERKAIVSVVQQNLLLIQISLFVILVCLITYMFVPAPYSHNIAFLLLSVNIAIGFFLWK